MIRKADHRCCPHDNGIRNGGDSTRLRENPKRITATPYSMDSVNSRALRNTSGYVAHHMTHDRGNDGLNLPRAERTQ